MTFSFSQLLSRTSTALFSSVPIGLHARESASYVSRCRLLTTANCEHYFISCILTGPEHWKRYLIMRSAIRGLWSGARAGNEIFEKSEMKDWSDVFRFKRTRCLRGLWVAEKLEWKEIARNDPPLNDSSGSSAPLGAIFQDFRLSSLNFHASVIRGREENKFLASKKSLFAAKCCSFF